jgi:asparagine synthase (glutamine-hydrolysing)
MCGVAGAIDAVEGRATARVALLNQWQRHRGPDHDVVAQVGPFTLGNTRLAIQDPGPAGNQPFSSPDGRYTCVFNGEIYNHRRVVEEYRLPVRTGCDGEVIPHLWAKLGPRALTELRGMFAIALVDSLEERLYLARDSFGIKPLYWRRLPDAAVVFASEVRSLARLARGVRVSSEAVARYLYLGAMAADQSPFCEINALPPNSVGCFEADGRVTTRPILSGGPLVPGGDVGLGPALTESIGLHLDADVPTALLLSAGTDSAAIAAVGRRLGRTLNCLTVATQDAADETDGAARTARRYGHRFRRVPAVLAVSDVAGFFAAMQRPSIDGLNTYLVCRAVRDAGFKVALSGLGGDEVVGGYSGFRLLRFLRALRVADPLPGPVAGLGTWAIARLGLAGEHKARRLLGPGGPRGGAALSLLQREVLSERVSGELTGTGAWPAGIPRPGSNTEDRASFRMMVAAEVANYLQAMLLPDADGFSMTWSVELRVPFVDRHVFAASLAPAGDSARIPGKTAVGAALGDPHLRRIAARRKRGFSVPMRRWMTDGPLTPVLAEAEQPDAPVWSVLDRAAAQRAGLLPLASRERWAGAWAVAALDAWLRAAAC